MLTKNRSFVLILLLLSLCSKEIISETLEEIVVLGDWRQTSPDQEDSSVVLLDTNTIEAQSTNHFEQLAYFVPNLNFAASDSRAR